jgi:hypothetical protein
MGMAARRSRSASQFRMNILTRVSLCRVVLSVMLSTGVAGCGVLSANNCDLTHQYQDSFTGECREKTPQNRPTTPTSPGVQLAYCVCGLSTGETVAYFSSRPFNYGTKGPISVSTTVCQDTRLCMAPNTVFSSQTITIRNIFNWQYDARFGTYGAFGFRQDASNEIDRQLSKRGYSLVRLFLSNYSHIKRVAAVKPKDNSIPFCRQECQDDNSVYCSRVPVGSTERAGLRRLQQLLATNPAIIKKSNVLAMFGQGVDECDRGDTIFEEGHVANIGGSTCYLTTSFLDVTVRIQLPELLRGKYSANRKEVEFDDPTTRPNIQFSDQWLDKDWGGDIVAAFSAEDQIGFSVGAESCLRADLK